MDAPTIDVRPLGATRIELRITSPDGSVAAVAMDASDARDLARRLDAVADAVDRPPDLPM